MITGITVYFAICDKCPEQFTADGAPAYTQISEDKLREEMLKAGWLMDSTRQWAYCPACAPKFSPTKEK